MNKLLLLLPLTLLLGCKKNNPGPASQLPAATQTGANTFGCLVNGQPYTPSGYNGTTNFAVLYEPGLNGATLNILTYSEKNDGIRYINLSCGPIVQPRTFSLSIPFVEGGASFTDTSISSPCGSYEGNSAPSYRKGALTITRLDLQAGIISGTFDFVLAQPGCDTVKVTQGRFDKKL